MNRLLIYCCILYCVISLLCIDTVECKPRTRSNTKHTISTINTNNNNNDQSNETMNNFNTNLYNIYINNKQNMLHKLINNKSIYILTVDDKLTLYHNNINKPIYQSIQHTTLSTQLKYINHLSLSLLVLLQPTLALYDIYKNDIEHIYNIDNGNMQQLIQFKQYLNNMYIDIYITNLTDQQQYNTLNIYNNTYEIVQQLLDTKQVTIQQIKQYCNNIRQSIDELTYNAADSILTNIHNNIHNVLLQNNNNNSNGILSIDDLHNLYVLCNLGSHMASHNDIHTTYFKQFFNYYNICDNNIHVIYNQYDTMSNNGLDSLSMHLIDSYIGYMMYDNKQHMHSDVMAQPGIQITNKLLPLKQQSYIYQYYIYNTIKQYISIISLITITVLSYIYIQRQFTRKVDTHLLITDNNDNKYSKP